MAIVLGDHVTLRAFASVPRSQHPEDYCILAVDVANLLLSRTYSIY